MHADVAFGQYGNPTDPAARREGVEVDVQERGSRGVHRVPHGALDAIFVVEAFGLPKIDDQMAPGERDAIARDEVICGGIREDGDGLRSRDEFDRLFPCNYRQTKFALSHIDTDLPKVWTPKRAVTGAPTQEESGGRKDLPQHAASNLLKRAAAGYGDHRPHYKSVIGNLDSRQGDAWPARFSRSERLSSAWEDSSVSAPYFRHRETTSMMR
jgi:hypothetical protein